MAHSVKRFFKGILCENHISSYDIDYINDVHFSEEDNKLKISIVCLDGTKPILHVKYTDFLNWITKKYKNKKDLFKNFAIDFLESSDSEKGEELKEIIDDDGNIMGDDDLPNNSTNTMIGTDNHWDTDHIANSVIPHSKNFYSGPYGRGYTVW